MTSYLSYFFLLICCISFSISSKLLAQTEVLIEIENPIDDNEPRELEYYIYSNLIGSENPQRDAENSLKDLDRFESIECTYSEGQESKLVCRLKRFRIVQNIQFTGIPLLVLEKELRKRLPIKTGDLINLSDSKYNDLVKRSETAIISYLERQGFFNAKAAASYSENGGTPSTDIVFNVAGGSFVKVRNVVLKTNLRTVPLLDKETVLAPFRKMCSNIRYSFEGIFQGTKSCYNKDIEEEIITSVEETLANLGYVETHISVKKHFVERKDLVPNEVDLEVHLRTGPQLFVNFEFKDAQVLDLGFFSSLLRSITNIEFFSRAFDLPSPKAQYPEDKTILVNGLREVLTFKAEQTLDDEQIANSVMAIKEYLRSRGYLHAHVDYAKEAIENSAIKVTFKIDPKEPAHVSSIRLFGAKHFSFEFLNEQLALQIQPRSLFSSGHFSLANLTEDQIAIQKFFVSNGFADATVEALIEQANNGIGIIYKVELGEQKMVNRLIFKNHRKKLTREFLDIRKPCEVKQISIESDIATVHCNSLPYQKDQLENFRLQLFDLYRKNGFLKTEPIMTLTQSEEGLDVVFDLPNTASRAKVAELLINGNLKTLSSVIEREIGPRFISPNSEYLPFKIDESLGRLRSYGVFSRLSMDHVPKTNSEDEYYLYLNIAEKPTFTGDLPFAFDSDYYFNIGFHLHEKNLFGALLHVKTEIDFGLFIGRKSLVRNVVSWPRIFGTPMKIDFRIPELLYEILATEKIPKRHAQLKTSIQLQWEFLKILYPKIEFLFRIDKWQLATSSSDFQNLGFFQDPIKAILTLDGLLDVLAEDASLRATLIPSLSAVSVDNFLDPKFGYKLSTSFQISPKAFGNGIGFNVLDLKGAGYYTLGPLTFAGMFQLQRGFIQDPLNNWYVLRYESDFETLGGARGPRAYPKGQIGILGPLLDQSGNPPSQGVDIDYHPGNLLIQTGLELRFPLAQKFLLGRLDGAAFAELGFIGSCTTDFFCFDQIGTNTADSSNRQLGSTLGAGLRLMLPVGPLAVDYGFSLEHNISRINFQFGYPF